VLKNPLVSFSEPRSEVENPVLWMFWTCSGGVWACFGTTDRSDNYFFNRLARL
jgi:hypothetical protein